jgi:hypothetical protein
MALSYFGFRAWVRSQVGKSKKFMESDKYADDSSKCVSTRISDVEKRCCDNIYAQGQDIHRRLNAMNDLKVVSDNTLKGLQGQINILNDHVQNKLGQKIDERVAQLKKAYDNEIGEKMQNKALYYGDVISRKDKEIGELKNELDVARQIQASLPSLGLNDYGVHTIPALISSLAHQLVEAREDLAYFWRKAPEIAPCHATHNDVKSVAESIKKDITPKNEVRKIEYSVVKNNSPELLNKEYLLYITKQTHLGDDFTPKGDNSYFRKVNGVVLRSCTYPLWIPASHIAYLCGNGDTRDNEKPLKFSCEKDLDDVVAAIEQYNKEFSGEKEIEPEPVFVGKPFRIISPNKPTEEDSFQEMWK